MGEGVIGLAIVDNEKLDNQQLKKFKNKGCDLEKSIAKICMAHTLSLIHI